MWIVDSHFRESLILRNIKSETGNVENSKGNESSNDDETFEKPITREEKAPAMLKKTNLEVQL